MKKTFIFALFAILILTGCAQDETFVVASSPSSDISVGLNDSESNSLGTVDVRIENSTTVPKEVDISVDGSVTFINNQDKYVNLFVDNQIIDIKPDSKFTHIFDTSGEFRFTINNNIEGTVFVK